MFGEFSEQFPESFDGPLFSAAEEPLELGERLFDRIDVGTIGRQVDEPRADLLDRRAYVGDFVHREIVHHDDVARVQRRHELLLDMGDEQRTVDGGQRREAARTECGDEGRLLQWGT